MEISWEKETQEKLDQAGLSSSQWDNETIAIHTHPLLLKDVEKAVRYLLNGESIAKSDFATLARRACRSVRPTLAAWGSVNTTAGMAVLS